MILVPLLVVVAPPNLPKVAFTARFYNPPGSRRPTTHSQLYICDLDGRHRRQLTFDRWDAYNAQWESPRTIRFSRWKGGGHPVELMRADIRSGRVKFVGVPRKEQWKVADEPSEWSPSVVERLGLDGPIPPPLEGVRIFGGYLTIEGPTGSKPVGLKNLSAAYRVLKTGDLWLVTQDWVGHKGPDTDVYRLERKTLKLIHVLGPADDADWRPTRDAYAYTTHREVFDYTTRWHRLTDGNYPGVWCSELWVGNWRTGKKRRLVGGLAEVTSGCLSP